MNLILIAVLLVLIWVIADIDGTIQGRLFAIGATAVTLVCLVMLHGLRVCAAELTDETIGDTAEMQLAEEIPDYTVLPGDEVRGTITISNSSEDTWVCTDAESGWSSWTADVVYDGYRDATDNDVDGLYWGRDREVTGGGNDVQAHIDSGLWTSAYDYFVGTVLEPGATLDVGYVMSFDGIKMDNAYQLSNNYYFCNLWWTRQTKEEPNDEPTGENPSTPSSDVPSETPQDSPVPGVPAVEDTIPELLEVVEQQVEVLCLRTTGYTGDEGYTGITKSGVQVGPGQLAGPEAWLGRTCDLYDMEGNLLGTYTFTDTGNPEYVNETRIDMWFATDAELAEFQRTVGDYTYLVWR